MNTYYGLTDRIHIRPIALAVCDTLGHGKNHKALQLLLGTAAQETHYGTFLDPTTYGAGVGVTQHDPIGFYDVRDRLRDRHKDKVRDRFGIDMNAVEHRELAYSPLLALIWCRAHYKLVPEEIPTTIEGLANYWKRYYNTEAGRGTSSEFIENYHRFIGTVL